MSGSKLIELLRQQAVASAPRGVELATVVTPPPELVIRVDNMAINLEEDDLLVCSDCLRTVGVGEPYLAAGSRVAVMVLPGGQQYLVIDKVVEMGG